MNVAELEELIEYKFAPGPLLAVQGFANTYSFENEEELLPDPDTARDWLVRTGLGAPGLEVSEEELEELVELRALIRSMLEANLSGDGEVDAAALAHFTSSRRVPIAAAAGGGIEIDLEPAETVEVLVGQLLGVAMAARLEGTWERLKICAADNCRWAFYDSSRNRGGHWCSMELCGNREKNRRYRAAR
jgi:predicted RNA-binding Zn ribbon-like protein